ncbi:hypothetical protein [Campylobacter sp. LH-2024]|uniref:hypothetical protein n=1 Tax=Campylobacter sp. LH-2024 TaxID=3239825 RepID=UPI003B76345D
MLINEKRLMGNFTLKPAYPANIGELDTKEVYKQWFTYAMIGVNKYVELLHKQLIRKGRAIVKNVNHPLYKNSYIVKKYNIKSPSTAPYNKNNYNDLGLNQFFVGQDPYKPYQGDPSDKNGIYHDICEIKPNYTLNKINYYFGFPEDLILLFDKKDALRYPNFYYIDEDINFKKFLNKALENVQYEELINNSDIVIFLKIFNKNGKFVYPSVDDFNIPEVKAEWKKITNGLVSRNKLCVDIEKFYNDFKNLNNHICKTQKVEIYYQTYKKIDKARESDGSYYALVNETIPFLSVFNIIKNHYNFKYGSPLCINKDFNLICYKEPYIAFGTLDKNFGKKETLISPSIYPLYRKGSNLPYGRRDRWFALWDNFYYLYVYEKSNKGILSFLAPIVSIVLAVATWWIGGQGVWLSGLLGISESIAMGITLSVSIGLAIGSLGGNKIFSILSVVWDVVNFIGTWANNSWNLAANFTKTTAQAAKEMTSFEALLNVLENTLSGASKILDLVQNITADNPNVINEQSNDNKEDIFGSGSEAVEIAKDMINPTIWYNFETQDLLSQEIKKTNQPIFIF